MAVVFGVAVLVGVVVVVAAAVVLIDGESEAAPGLTAGQMAESARLTELAAYHDPQILTRGQLADAARWTALARVSAFDALRGDISLSREHVAAEARLTGLAESMGIEPVYANGLTKAQLAAALRYQGLAAAAGR